MTLVPLAATLLAWAVVEEQQPRAGVSAATVMRPVALWTQRLRLKAMQTVCPTRTRSPIQTTKVQRTLLQTSGRQPLPTRLSQLQCVGLGASLQALPACPMLPSGRKRLHGNAWNRNTCLTLCRASRSHTAKAVARQRLPKGQAAKSKPAKTKTATRKRALKRQQKQPRTQRARQKAQCARHRMFEMHMDILSILLPPVIFHNI